MPNDQKTVLVTRPEHQSANLCAMLSAEGFLPTCYPTIEIQPIDNPSPAIRELQDSNDYDYLIFVSANAVLQADQLINHQWPQHRANIVAIGPKTAGTLQKISLKPTIISAKPFNSEHLLAQFPDELKQKKGLLIKGKNGRTLLAETLRKRGMLVNCVDVYQRALPSNYGHLDTKIPFYITITSQLALDNLFLMLPKQTGELKQRCHFVVFSQRIAHYAESLGCQQISLSQEASDQGLVSAITHATKR